MAKWPIDSAFIRSFRAGTGEMIGNNWSAFDQLF